MKIVYFTIKSTQCTQEQLSLLYDVVKENVAACALMGQHQASAYCSTPAPAPFLLPPGCEFSLIVELLRLRCKIRRKANISAPTWTGEILSPRGPWDCGSSWGRATSYYPSWGSYSSWRIIELVKTYTVLTRQLYLSPLLLDLDLLALLDLLLLLPPPLLSRSSSLYLLSSRLPRSPPPRPP